MSYEYEDENDNRNRHENYRREEVYNQLIPVQRKKIDKSKTFIIRFRVIASLLSLLVSFVFGWVIGHSFEYGFIGLFFGFMLFLVYLVLILMSFLVLYTSISFPSPFNEIFLNFLTKAGFNFFLSLNIPLSLKLTI